MLTDLLCARHFLPTAPQGGSLITPFHKWETETREVLGFVTQLGSAQTGTQRSSRSAFLSLHQPVPLCSSESTQEHASTPWCPLGCLHVHKAGGGTLALGLGNVSASCSPSQDSFLPSLGGHWPGLGSLSCPQGWGEAWGEKSRMRGGSPSCAHAGSTARLCVKRPRQRWKLL